MARVRPTQHRPTAELSPLRIPCPFCREPVHPVAGRCRHCRRDLPRIGVAAAPAAPRPRRRAARLGFVVALAVTAAAAVTFPLLGG